MKVMAVITQSAILLHYNYNHFTALWTLSGTTQVSRYQKKHPPTHTYRGYQSLICFLHLLRSMASSFFNLRARQSFSAISHQVFIGMAPTTSYSIHFFNQSLSSFFSTCPEIDIQLVMDDFEISKPDLIFLKISISNYERFLQSTPAPPSD